MKRLRLIALLTVVVFFISCISYYPGSRHYLQLGGEVYAAPITSTVVNQAYDTSGNGGRKLVRLSNGWLVAVAFDNNETYKFFVSKDGGSNWSNLCYLTHNPVDATYKATSGIAICSVGTIVHILFRQKQSSDGNQIMYTSFDASTQTNTAITFCKTQLTNSLASSRLSLVADSNGVLHAAWSDKFYSINSYNIRYSKSTDGGTLWATPTQITTYSAGVNGFDSPCVIINNDQPAIISLYNANNSMYQLFCNKYSGTAWSSVNSGGGNLIYSGGSFAQYDPSAIVTSDNSIHVVWSSYDSVNTANTVLRHSKSVDAGGTWVTQTGNVGHDVITNSSGNTISSVWPSITADRKNNLYVYTQIHSTSAHADWSIGMVKCSNNIWSDLTYIDMPSSRNDNYSRMYPQTCSNYLDFTNPLVIWLNKEFAAVKFSGDATPQSYVTTINLKSPSENETFSEVDTGVIPKIEVSDAEKDTLTCKMYIDSETTPRDTKIVTGATTTQTAIFSPVDMSKLSEGQHTMKFDVNNGVTSTQSTVNFKVDKSPAIGNVSITTSPTGISVSGSATDGLNLNGFAPYNITINDQPSGWKQAESTPIQNTTMSALADTSVAGGRKLVKLSNGTLVSAVKNGTTSILYNKSTDNGNTWSQLCSANGNYDSGFAITSYGTTVYTLATAASSIKPYFAKFDAATVTNTAISMVSNNELTQTSFGPGCSLEVDSQGNLHAAWSAKNTTSSNNFNLCYAKSINGGGSWTKYSGISGFDQVTSTSTSGENFTWPSICLSNNKPVIASVDTGTNINNIVCNYTNGSSWAINTIYSSGTYAQTNPSIAADNSTIHVWWQGRESGSIYNIRHSQSTNGGVNWSNKDNLTSETIDQTSPSGNVGPNGSWYVLFQGRSSGSIDKIRKVVSNGTTIGAITDINPTTPSGISSYPSVCGNYSDVNNPVFMYQDAQTSKVKFYGANSTDAVFTYPSTLSSNTQYNIKFEARDAAGNKGSYTKDVYTKAATPVISAATSPTSIKVTINDSNDALKTDYQIMCGNKYVTAAGTLSSNPVWAKFPLKTVTITGLSQSTQYVIKAKARNGDGVETETVTAASGDTVTTPKTLGVPSNLSATVSNHDITITWDGVEGATAYETFIDGSTTTSAISYDTFYKHIISDGNEHTYKVRAVGNGEYGANSEPITAKAQSAPLSATTVTAISTSATSITIEWNTISGASKYEIEIDGAKITTGYKQKPTDNTKYIYTHKGLAPHTQHTYRVRAYKGTQPGTWSSMLIAITGDNGPGTPRKNNEIVTDNSIAITWKPVADAQFYKVLFDGITYENGTSTNFIMYGLVPNSSHKYRIAAYNMSNGVENEIWSSLVDYDVKTMLLPTPVISGYTEDVDRISISWQPVPGATSYVVYRNTTAAGITVTGNSYLDTGLVKNSPYTYWVKAINISGESSLCENVTLMTLPQRPGVPGSITVMASQDKIRLDWAAIPTMSGITIGYDVILDGVEIDNDSLISYTHDGLEPNTIHTYKIRSKTDMIESEWSNEITVKTLPGNPVAPKNITVTSSSTNTKLTWERQDGDLSYDIEIYSSDLDPYTLVPGPLQLITTISAISKNEYLHRGNNTLQEYMYRIRTHNMVGESEWSGYIVNNSIKAYCKRDNTLTLGLTAMDITDFSQYTMTLTYNPNVMEVTDLCIQTSEKELEAGEIVGTGIIVKSFTPGKIEFVVDKVLNPDEAWTGVINSIQFKAKVTGGTHLTYTVIGKPAEEQ